MIKHTCDHCPRSPEVCYCESHLDEITEKTRGKAYVQGYDDGYEEGYQQAKREIRKSKQNKQSKK
jgi:flagellar biosynthesis/type III secretory pathway protein FliH